MNSISIQIKKLNDRLLTKNIVIQTLISILIENDIVTEEEFELKIENNLDDVQDIIKSIDNVSLENDEEDLVTSSMYFGPHGEA